MIAVAEDLTTIHPPGSTTYPRWRPGAEDRWRRHVEAVTNDRAIGERLRAIYQDPRLVRTKDIAEIFSTPGAPLPVNRVQIWASPKTPPKTARGRHPQVFPRPAVETDAVWLPSRGEWRTHYAYFLGEVALWLVQSDKFRFREDTGWEQIYNPRHGGPANLGVRNPRRSHRM